MAKKVSSTQLVHIRMPIALHRKIQKEAERGGQTLNAEILKRLEAADQYQALIKRAGKMNIAVHGDDQERTFEQMKEVTFKIGGKEYVFRSDDPLEEELIEKKGNATEPKDKADD